MVPEVLPFTTSGDIYVQSFDFPFNFPKIGVPLGSKSATLHFWKAHIKAYSCLKFDGAAAKKNNWKVYANIGRPRPRFTGNIIA